MKISSSDRFRSYSLWLDTFEGGLTPRRPLEGDIAADYLEELLDIADLDGDLDMDVEGDEASVAEWGRFKLCRDDQGSSFGLHQPPPGA